MKSVKEHYQQHLGHFYSWMMGDFDARKNEQKNFFQHQSISPGRTGRALDLGCGHGIQSVALAELGFSVTAVDFDETLLGELATRKGALSIETRACDLLTPSLYDQSTDVVACMGDTLTHLPSKNQVRELLYLVSNSLVENGQLVLSFRDLTQELEGDQRIIPVRADEQRIHTCLLEYFPNFVRVTDILHEREQGAWHMRVSSYAKLRLSAALVSDYLREAGFVVVEQETIQRMIYLVASKKA